MPRSWPPRPATGPAGAAPAASAKPASPGLKRLAGFSTDAIPGIAAALAAPASGAWIDAGQPAVLPGDSGTGKTHLLTGLGLAACEQGRRVRYATTAQLVNELAEAANARQPANPGPACMTLRFRRSREPKLCTEPRPLE